MLKDLKVEVVDALEINGPPTDEDMKRVVDIGKALAKRIFEAGG
jgi:flavorubredoxin